MKTVTVQDIQELVRANKLSHEDIIQKANHHLNNNELEQAYPYAGFLANTILDSVATIMTTGMIALTLNKRDEAKGYFQAVLDRIPDHYDAAYNTALINIEDNDLPGALDRLQQLSLTYPREAGLYNDIAVIHSNLHNIDDAFTSWHQSLVADPNNSQARNNALEFTLETGLYEQGIELLTVNLQNNNITDKSVQEIKHWKGIVEQRMLDSDCSDCNG